MGRSISLSPSTTSRAPRTSTRELTQSSGVLSDALRRLTAVAHDRQSTPSTATGADEDLLRTLESLAQPKVVESFSSIGVYTLIPAHNVSIMLPKPLHPQISSMLHF
jgi:hypothetical protein